VTAHSPTPWTFREYKDGKYEVYATEAHRAEGNFICAIGDCPEDSVAPDRTDAAFVVRAVNAHEALVAVAELLLRTVADYDYEGPAWVWDTKSNGDVNLETALRTALALARGE